MGIFGQGLGGIGNVLSVLLPFLFVLTIVVFIHELGHFLVARWCGVKIKAFSIGFGREIFGFYDRYGTRWRFAWIPLGGYVKFLDDENSASVPSKAALEKMTPAERAGAFQTQPLAARSAIVAAGPVANFLLAIVIFALTFTFVGVQVTAPRVDELVADGAAASAGFKPGDVIVSIDGQAIETFADMQRIVSASADHELTFEVNRGGVLLKLKVTPARREISDRFGNKLRVGVIGIRRNPTQAEWEFKRYGPIESLGLGVKETVFIITRTLSYLGDVIMGLESADQMRGPIGIAEISGQVASAGHRAAAQPHGRAVREHRAHQSLPDPAAGWWSPFVLPDRGRAPQAAERADAGDRFPHRARRRADAHDVRNVERSRHREAVALGNRLELRQRAAVGRIRAANDVILPLPRGLLNS